MECEVCPVKLVLPPKMFLYCDHCSRRMCRTCIIKHARKLTLENVQVPRMLNK